jgi:hypothetical protein
MLHNKPSLVKLYTYVWAYQVGYSEPVTQKTTVGKIARTCMGIWMHIKSFKRRDVCGDYFILGMRSRIITCTCAYMHALTDLCENLGLTGHVRVSLLGVVMLLELSRDISCVTDEVEGRLLMRASVANLRVCVCVCVCMDSCVYVWGRLWWNMCVCMYVCMYTYTCSEPWYISIHNY